MHNCTLTMASPQTRVAWKATSSRFAESDVRSLAQGVARRYREATPERPTSLPLPVRAAPQQFGTGTGTAGRALLYEANQATSPTAPVVASSARGGAGTAPAARRRSVAVHNRVHDHMLTAPAVSLSEAGSSHTRSRRSRGKAKRASRAHGHGRQSSAKKGALKSSFDYLPPQYAQARQAASKGGRISIDEFLSNRSAPRAYRTQTRAPPQRGSHKVKDTAGHDATSSPHHDGSESVSSGTSDQSAASEYSDSETSYTSSSDEEARRVKQERAVAQIMFQQLQAQRADREHLAKEVAQLKAVLRRRSTMAPDFLRGTNLLEELATHDVGSNTDPVATTSQSVQVCLEMPDTPEVSSMRDELSMLRVGNKRQRASMARAHRKIEELELELAHARADTEESRQQANKALEAIRQKRGNVSDAHVETTSKGVGTDLRWASIMATTQSRANKLSDEVVRKDTQLEEVRSQVKRLEGKVAELNALVAEQHERCAVLGAEVHSLERQLEASKAETSTVRTAMESQAQALQLASRQQTFLQDKLDKQLVNVATRPRSRSRSGSNASSPRTRSPRASDSPRGSSPPKLRRKSSKSKLSKRDSSTEPNLQKPKLARRKSRVVAAAMSSFLGRYETIRAANIIQNARKFRDLGTDQAQQLVKACTILLFKDGENLLTQGERGHFLFIILEGESKIVLESSGTKRELFRRGPGEVVGEFAIFSDEPRKASVVAVGRVKALLLTRDKYMELYTACVGTSLHVVLEKLTTLPSRKASTASTASH